MSSALALEDDYSATSLDVALATADTQAQAQEPTRTDIPQELLRRPTIAGLIGYALLDWAMIGGFWLGMYFSPAWLYPLWALLVGGRIHSFGVILHDATHMPLRGKSASVRVLEVLSGYPLATTLNAMRYHHLRHHKDSGMDADPYFKRTAKGRPLVFAAIWVRHLILIPFWTLRGLYGSLAFHIPAMRQSYAVVFLQDRSQKNMRNHKEVITCAREEHGQLAFHLAVGAVAYVLPYEVLFFYIIPAAVAGLLAGYRILIEHDYIPTTDRQVSTIIKTTVDHSLGGLGQFIFGPRNIGYHIVHHLHPQVALGALPKVRAWYKGRYASIYPKPYARDSA